METIKIIKKDNYAIIQLDRGKGNAINMQMMKEVAQACDELENDEAIRGAIISGKAPIFSVGLDVKELLSLDKEGANTFFDLFQEMIIKLISFPKMLIAAVTGHSPAGGCIIAITCDYRVMAEGPYSIGLNEVPVGIMVPPHVFEMYSFWIGKRNAYHNFLEGRLLSPSEAKEQGLVDAVVAADEVLNWAENKMQKLLRADATTLLGVKHNLKMPLLNNMKEQINWDVVNPKEHFWLPTSRETLMKVILALMEKKMKNEKCRMKNFSISNFLISNSLIH